MRPGTDNELSSIIIVAWAAIWHTRWSQNLLDSEHMVRFSTWKLEQLASPRGWFIAYTRTFPKLPCLGFLHVVGPKGNSPTQMVSGRNMEVAHERAFWSVPVADISKQKV